MVTVWVGTHSATGGSGRCERDAAFVAPSCPSAGGSLLPCFNFIPPEGGADLNGDLHAGLRRTAMCTQPAGLPPLQGCGGKLGGEVVDWDS